MTKLLDPEEGGTVILQNIGNFTPNTTVSHPERLEPSDLKFMNCLLGPVEYFYRDCIIGILSS
jgi:hypothetical protein